MAPGCGDELKTMTQCLLPGEGSDLLEVPRLDLGVDVGVVRDLRGRGQPVRHLHRLHPGDAAAPEEEAPRGDVGEPLDHDDRLVAGEVGHEEDGHEEAEGGVRPHGVDVAVGLLEGDVGGPLGADEVLGEEGLRGAELLEEPEQAQETGDQAPVHSVLSDDSVNISNWCLLLPTLHHLSQLSSGRPIMPPLRLSHLAY